VSAPAHRGGPDGPSATPRLTRKARTFVVAFVVAVVVPLAGCAAIAEEDYLRALEKSAPALHAANSRHDLTGRGREACNALATDALPTLFDGRAVDGSSGATEWSRILDAAVDSLCTEHRTRLDEWMNEHK